MSEQRACVLATTVTATDSIQAGRAVAPGGGLAAAGGPALGLAYFDADAGQDLTVEMLGLLPATAGAAISVGQALEVGANGKLVPQSSGEKVARALTSAAGDGRTVQVTPIPN